MIDCKIDIIPKTQFDYSQRKGIEQKDKEGAKENEGEGGGRQKKKSSDGLLHQFKKSFLCEHE